MLFNPARVRRFVAIERPTLRKLEQLDLATRTEDMRTPPGNRLEALRGDRAEHRSVRVNDRFRICFRWSDGAEEARSDRHDQCAGGGDDDAERRGEVVASDDEALGARFHRSSAPNLFEGGRWAATAAVREKARSGSAAVLS